MKKNFLPDVMSIFGIIVAALFIILGLYLIFSSGFNNIPKETRTILGVVVMIYGVFRSVTIFQNRNKNEEDE